VCGYKKAAVTYCLQRPGAQPLGVFDLSAHGQNEIISTMALSRFGMVACGSYDGTVGLYTDAGSFKPYFLIPKMHRRSGVAQVMFSPCGGFLYTGGRKDGKIHCWKMRAGSGAKPLYSLARPQVKKTNRNDRLRHPPSRRAPLHRGQELGLLL